MSNSHCHLETETMTVQQPQLIDGEEQRWTVSSSVNKTVFILWQFELL